MKDQEEPYFSGKKLYILYPLDFTINLTQLKDITNNNVQ